MPPHTSFPQRSAECHAPSRMCRSQCRTAADLREAQARASAQPEGIDQIPWRNLKMGLSWVFTISRKSAPTKKSTMCPAEDLPGTDAGGKDCKMQDFLGG